MIGQLRVSTGGTLYATNFKIDGGMERSLNPTYSLEPTFETVTDGLDNRVTLSGLWLSNHQLWSIDTTNSRLMIYTDSLAEPVTLSSPENKAEGIGTIVNDTISKVTLEWEVTKGATEYQWQLDDEKDFSSIPAGFEGSTGANQVKSKALELATTYYWRVRATEPVLSPWSAEWSFTTNFNSEIAAPILYTPEADAIDIPLKPIFEWSDIDGADSYELLVSADDSFDDSLISKVGDDALTTTTWQCDLSLQYNTTYYWKVRTRSSDSYSAWSAVSVFTTTTEPPSPPNKVAEATQPSPPSSSPSSPPPAPPPAPPTAQQTTPDWVFYMLGLMGFLIISLLATILVLVIRRH